MLGMTTSGDSHPKTFTLTTDDADGELARLKQILVDECDAEEDDPLRQWLESHTAEQFAAGVVVPTDQIGYLAEVLEGDWPDALGVIDQAREEHLAELEGKAGQ